MKTKILILLLFVTLVSWQNKRETTGSFVEDVLKYYAGKTSISYDVSYRIKIFDSEDTLKINSTCHLIRNASDSIFGGEIWYDGKIDDEIYEKYYDLSSIYRINHNKKTVIRYDPETEAFGITGNYDGQIINTCFLKPDKLLEKVTNPLYSVIQSDTVISNVNYLKVQIHSPDEEEIKDYYYTLFISRSTKLIEKITFRVALDDQHQYCEWNLSNINFDKISHQTLKNNFLKRTSGYLFQEFERKSQTEVAPLKNGTAAPEFSGISTTGEDFNLGSLRGKIVLLDFWYLACYPCAKSIPHLVNLQNKFKDRDVVVIGLNSIDREAANQQKIAAFIQKKAINYPIIVVDSVVANRFNIHAYPTLYVIDKNGIIQDSFVGLTDSYQNDLEISIERLSK